MIERDAVFGRLNLWKRNGAVLVRIQIVLVQFKLLDLFFFVIQKIFIIIFNSLGFL